MARGFSDSALSPDYPGATEVQQESPELHPRAPDPRPSHSRAIRLCSYPVDLLIPDHGFNCSLHTDRTQSLTSSGFDQSPDIFHCVTRTLATSTSLWGNKKAHTNPGCLLLSNTSQTKNVDAYIFVSWACRALPPALCTHAFFLSVCASRHHT